MEHVILVDTDDRYIGTMEKQEAHQKGVLHRAFSVLVFNSKGELLIQKRARTKYHSGGLWTNTCCSHPLPGEQMEDAIRRKLLQEMGIDVLLKFSYKFHYFTMLDNGLKEHEIDYVFIGKSEHVPRINTGEVEDWKYCDLEALKKDAKLNPGLYTPWFRLILEHQDVDAKESGVQKIRSSGE